MRELDMLLLGYVDAVYPGAAAHEQAAFRRLLTTPDPEILSLLTGRSQTDDEHLADVIQRVLNRNTS
jgi:succinate dehydrogenase flavin-adding protein (antitoxin of CptAB toxin-antitoxin module)